jgi:hypothetical protein
MDANAPRRGGSDGPRTGGLAVVAAVVALVAIVAIASSGGVPSGSISQRRPSEGLLDTFISLFVVMMAIGAVLVAVMLSFFGRYMPGGKGLKRRSTTQSVLTFAVALCLLAIFIRVTTGSDGTRATIFPPGSRDPGPEAAAPTGGYDPEFAVWPVVGVTAFVLVALGAWWLSARGRRRTRASLHPTPEEALADVLAATLDDLRNEGDPRRAVIGAYARMERSLAAVGMPRAAAEAPDEYLARVLAGIAVSERAAGRLTALFTWARFSGHDVRPAMKDEAIETLEHVQRDLAAAEAEREGRLAGARALA